MIANAFMEIKCSLIELRSVCFLGSVVVVITDGNRVDDGWHNFLSKIQRKVTICRREGLEPAVVAAIPTMKFDCEAFCSMEDAQKEVGEMERSGITPDVVTAEIGNGIWNLMVMRGCLPNLATFNARVQFLVCKGRAWQANSLMSMMRYLGIKPDEVTFNLVIKGFCRAGYIDMAKRVYSVLHDECYKPNARIYQTMMHYLCKEGEVDMAYTTCKNSMEKNWFPSVDSIYQLLQGLQTTRKIDKARFIVSLVHKRVPPLPVKQLRIMKSFLKKR
ncbi:hypothetical protein M8C21_026576 [Ambrosia artemisiifolia]|uniref:Pentatricopeptide repeat-containing protein n=1 Tax=Ambrosia artemisiifolia TaxID=4212 RepID=A0AAD5CJ83_AMBAR|nr:hypothetical protein M8C21_026576 [Ambrosia artemisiifolia]